MISLLSLFSDSRFFVLIQLIIQVSGVIPVRIGTKLMANILVNFIFYKDVQVYIIGVFNIYFSFSPIIK